jgi:NlpC/P60 family
MRDGATNIAEPTGAEFVALVRSCEGKPYIYGAAGPDAFDCSGLVYYNARRAGIKNCPRTSEEQAAWCKKVDSPSAGDLVFFVGAENDPPPGHVGVVVAPGVMIDAPHTGTVVQQANFGINGTGVDKFMGYGRMPGMSGSPSANASLIRSKPTRQEAGIIGDVIGFLVVAAIVAGLVLLFSLLIAAGIIFR